MSLLTCSVTICTAAIAAAAAAAAAAAVTEQGNCSAPCCHK